MEKQGVHVEQRRGLRDPARLPVFRAVHGEALPVNGCRLVKRKVGRRGVVRLVDEILNRLPRCLCLRLRQCILVEIPELVVVFPVVPAQILALEAYLRVGVVLDLDDDIIVVKDLRGVFVGAKIAQAEEDRLVRLHRVRADLNRRVGGVVEEHCAHGRFQTVSDSRIGNARRADARLIPVVPLRNRAVDDVILAGNVLFPAQQLGRDALVGPVHGIAFCNNGPVFQRDAVGQRKVDVRAGCGRMLYAGCALNLHRHRGGPFVLRAACDIGVLNGPAHGVLFAQRHALRVNHDEMGVRVFCIDFFQVDAAGPVIDVVAFVPGNDLRAILAVGHVVCLDLRLCQIPAVASQQVEIHVCVVRPEGDALGRPLGVALVGGILVIAEAAAALPNAGKPVLGILLDVDVQLRLLVLAGAQRDAGLVAVEIGVVRLDLQADASVHAGDGDSILVAALLDSVDDFELQAVPPRVAGKGHVIQRQPVAGGDPDAAHALLVSHQPAVYLVKVCRKAKNVIAVAPSGEGADRRRVHLDREAVCDLFHSRADGAYHHRLAFRYCAAGDGKRVVSRRGRAESPAVHGLVHVLRRLRHVVQQQADRGRVVARVHHHIRDLHRGVLQQLSAGPVHGHHRLVGRRIYLGHSGLQVIGFDGGAAYGHFSVYLHCVRPVGQPAQALAQAAAGSRHRVRVHKHAVQIGVDGLAAGAHRGDVKAQARLRVLVDLLQAPGQGKALLRHREGPGLGKAVRVRHRQLDRVGAVVQILEHINAVVSLLDHQVGPQRSARIDGKARRAGRNARFRVHRRETEGDGRRARAVQYGEIRRRVAGEGDARSAVRAAGAAGHGKGCKDFVGEVFAVQREVDIAVFVLIAAVKGEAAAGNGDLHLRVVAEGDGDPILRGLHILHIPAQGVFKRAGGKEPVDHAVVAQRGNDHVELGAADRLDVFAAHGLRLRDQKTRVGPDQGGQFLFG